MRAGSSGSVDGISNASAAASMSGASAVVPGGTAGADDEDVLEPRQLITDRSDLPLVERRGRDEHARLADRHAGTQRLGTEGGEERAQDGLRLPRAKGRDVELRDAPGEHVNAVALPDAQPAKHVGEAVRRAREIAEGEIARRPVQPEPADRDLVPAGSPPRAGRPPRARCSGRGRPAARRAPAAPRPRKSAPGPSRSRQGSGRRRPSPGPWRSLRTKLPRTRILEQASAHRDPGLALGQAAGGAPRVAPPPRGL